MTNISELVVLFKKNNKEQLLCRRKSIAIMLFWIITTGLFFNFFPAHGIGRYIGITIQLFFIILLTRIFMVLEIYIFKAVNQLPSSIKMVHGSQNMVLLNGKISLNLISFE